MQRLTIICDLDLLPGLKVPITRPDEHHSQIRRLLLAQNLILIILIL